MTMNEPSQVGLSSAELFRAHAGFVARFLYRLGVPAQAIDDAVQDVFVVVHQRGGYRPGPAKPTTYLALIASHAASVQRRRQRLSVARVGNTQPEELEVQSDDPAVHTERRDELRRLEDALTLLDPNLRDTLLLADCEEETAPAIADAMGVPVGTVYWRLHEARKKFQRALAVTDRIRAQAAAKRRPAARRGAQAHGAKLSLIFALFADRQPVELAGLFRAWQNTSFDFDLERGLRRHLELAAKLPAPRGALPSSAAKLTLGAGTGALKGAAWTVAAICTLIATFQMLTRKPGVVGEERGQQDHTVVASATAAASTQTVPRDVAHAEAAAHPVRAAAEEPIAEQATHPLQAGTTETAQSERGAVPQASEEHPPARATKAMRSAQTRLGGQSSTRSAPAQTRDSASRVGTTQPSAVPTGRAKGDAAAAEAAQSAAAAQPAAAPLAPSVAAQQAPNAKAEPSEPAQPERALANEQAPLLEAQALARADSLLATQPEKALAIVDGLARTAPHEYLAEERQYIQVMALYGLGRRSEAERAAHSFSSRYPASVFRERMSAARRAATAPP